MPRNSSGTYTLPAGNPVVPNTLIETTWANPTLADVGSALTDSLDRFGRGGMLAPLRFVDGTVTAPAVSFSSETTLGMFRPSAGTLALAVGGVSRFLLTAALLTVTVPVSLAGGISVGGLLDVDQLTNGSALQTISTVTPDWQMNGTTAAASFFATSRYSNGTSGPSYYFAHSRSATIGNHTVLASGDAFGSISFFGSDGTVYREGVRIIAEADGAPGASDMPGRLRVLVTPDSAITPVEAFRISNDKAALFAGTLSAADTLFALANAAVTTSLTVGSSLTVGTTLNVAGATILQTTVSMGSSATPANTRVYIDRQGTSVLPTLLTGTVLTLAGSSSAASTAHLQFIAGNAGSSTILFGDTDSAGAGGRVAYNHVNDTLSLYAGGVDVIDMTAAGLSPSVPFLFSNGTAAAPSISFTSSPTSGFYRAGADIIGVSIAGAAAWRFDASARLIGGGVGAQTTRISATSVTPSLQLIGSTLGPASLGGFMYDTSAASAAYLTLARSRSAAPGGFTIVQSGDALGRISVAGADGTQFTEAARIAFSVDGTPGANDMPGRIEFYTTPDGASAPTLALTLSQDSTATFTGGIVGTTVSLTETGTTTPIALNRLGSSVNCEVSYQTTAGTVYAGHGAANTFAVGGASSLNTTSWFSVAAAGANFTVNAAIAGTVSSTGTARFNGATQGYLGVMESTGSGATVNANADSLVIDSSGNGGLSILTPNTAVGAIYFGDPEGALQGRVSYAHSTDTLSLIAGAATALSMTNAAVTLGASEDLVLDGVGPTSTLSAGFRGVPQNSKSAAYTLVLSDAGRHIYHPSADTTARIWTIPANSSVAFPIGTAVTFVNDTSGGVITIAITTDTLVLAGTGGTGSRTLAANGVATAVKVTATRWVISGTALT